MKNCKNVHKNTHIDRGSLQIQDYNHILPHLLLEDYDTGHSLNMGFSKQWSTTGNTTWKFKLLLFFL